MNGYDLVEACEIYNCSHTGFKLQGGGNMVIWWKIIKSYFVHRKNYCSTDQLDYFSNLLLILKILIRNYAFHKTNYTK
mgnify:CR=1 FL=1